MKLRNVRLNLGNVARTTNAKSMSVNSASAIYEVDATGKEQAKSQDFKLLALHIEGTNLK